MDRGLWMAGSGRWREACFAIQRPLLLLFAQYTTSLSVRIDLIRFDDAVGSNQRARAAEHETTLLRLG